MDSSTFSKLDEDARRAECARLVSDARRQMARGNAAGDPPADLLRQLADAYDRLIAALVGDALAPDAMVAVVALGGYGRHEVYPYSDLDLLVLHEGASDAQVTALIERVIYPLWDAGVRVGHTVRSIDETLDLAATDLTVQTALLDARLLAGDAGPYYGLGAGAQREFFGPQRVNDFVARLADERRQRHARFGESVYLLEPNIKSNKGGLRDANTALWAAKARFGVTDFAQLPDVGAATSRQAQALTEARDFLRGLRLSMHLQAKRAQDQLLFELQEQLGPQMFPHDEIPGIRRRSTTAVAPAVERLMHAFYRHAHTIVLESFGVLERSRVPEGEAPTVNQIDEVFVQVGDELSCKSPKRFWERPSELVRAFEVAIDRDLRIDYPTRDAMAEAIAGEPGAQLAVDEEAARMWLELLCRDDLDDALRKMHDLGLIGAMIPEFEPCTGRVQHDMYHVYTVDQHTLYVVGALRELRAGGLLTQQYPLPAEVAAEVIELRSLYLAALLHDVAKPLGSGHATKGARYAAGVTARLGLSAEEQQLVTFLVREHLTMAHISQRRDLADPHVISDFAELVADEEHLRLLYLLTVADTAMTRPGNLTEWKASLLDALYLATLAHLRGEHGEQKAARDRRRHELARALSARWGTARRGARRPATGTIAAGAAAGRGDGATATGGVGPGARSGGDAGADHLARARGRDGRAGDRLRRRARAAGDDNRGADVPADRGPCGRGLHPRSP